MRAPTAVFVAISTSPAAGTGTGREWNKRAPGPPNASIAAARTVLGTSRTRSRVAALRVLTLIPRKTLWLGTGPAEQKARMGVSSLMAGRILLWDRLSDSASQLASCGVRRRVGDAAGGHLLLNRESRPDGAGGSNRLCDAHIQTSWRRPIRFCDTALARTAVG